MAHVFAAGLIRRTRWRRRCGLGLILGLAQLLTGQPSLADIQWRSVPAQSVPSPRSAGARQAEFEQLVHGEDRHVVVRFAQRVGPAERRLAKEAGVELLAYLGDNAFFAAVSTKRLDAGALDRSGLLGSVQTVERDFKLHPLLAAGVVPDWAVVGRTTSVRGGVAEEIVGAYVMFHGDVPLEPEGIDACLRHGAVIRSQIRSVNSLVIELPYSAITALADEDAVQWIEPPLPRLGELNNSNRVITGADVVQTSPYDLSGASVSVLVYDGGYAYAEHEDFGGRLTVRDESGLSDHATHVCGTIGGSGSTSGGLYRGMAPNVTIESYGYEYDGSGIFLYTNPGDLEADYSEAINTYGAVISNNSIGTNTATNGFDCEITGDYGITAQLIDTIVRGDASNPLFSQPFRVVWANGNERQTPRCGDTYYTTAPPACAKNHITVGALNSNDDSMTYFSSWGPTDDGRLKPDVAGPGCQSDGDVAVTSCSSAGAYVGKCGTSMSSPTVCGLGALLIEDFRVQFPGQPLFRNSTLKAWLAHSAQDLGNAGPDYQYGYGSVRIQQAIDLMRSRAFLEDSVNQGETFSSSVVIEAGDPELKVTLAWDDLPATPNVVPSLVNDLDLRVFSPSTDRHYPWTLEPADPGAPAGRTQEDHLNNMEQVLVDNPEPGTWVVEVYGYNVPDGPQSFSLVGDGAVHAGTSIGFPNGLPGLLAPGAAEDIDVLIVATGEELVPGSPTLHHRYDGGVFQASPLSHVNGDLYRATLPGAGCSDTPEFYFSAAGSDSGVVYQPAGAPATTFTAAVGELGIIFADDFETDRGWIAENLGASSGDWQRGVPVNDPNWQHAPTSDSDGSGQCYLTQNEMGNADVDQGAVRLTSPPLDLSGGAVDISYDYYLRLTDADSDIDVLLVEIDGNDGAGPWIQIARHNTDGGTSWRSQVIDQADLDAAGVVLTSTVRLRFTANDTDPQSINESGLDAFEVAGFNCVAPEQHTLTVGSTPTPGVPITVSQVDGNGLGDGVTEFQRVYGEGTDLTLTAPLRPSIGGAELVFCNWQVDGADQPDGQAALGHAVEANASLVAEYLRLGDVNGDGQTTVSDMDLFIEALLAPAGFEALHGPCRLRAADLNGSETVDGDDIRGFVEELTAAGSN